METVFAEKKTRTRVQGHFGQLSGVFAPLSGAEIEGYEIHMGTSGGESIFTVEGRVLGTYLHGLFDSGAFTCGLVDLLLDEKGVEWNGEQSCTEDARTFKERQYDRLADMLRRSLDMEAIYRILEQGLE